MDGPTALRAWLSSFPQLDSCDCNARDSFSSFDFVSKLVEVAKEIYDVELSVELSTVEEARLQLLKLLNSDSPSSDSEAELDDGRLLSTMLIEALSPSCPSRSEYVQRIMGMSGEVQRELMRIIQENANNCSDAEGDETADYSSILDGTMDGSIDEEEEELPDTTAILNRSALFEIDENRVVEQQDEDNSYLSEVEIKPTSDNETKQLQSTIEALQKQLSESRQQERNLTLQIDDLEASHKAEMIRIESQSIQSARQQEEKYSHEISELKRSLEHAQSTNQKNKQYQEENKQLRDELDVLNFSKEKLSYTEEALRKAREKLVELADAQSALEREEKSHAAAVEKCIALEGELAQLKPLKRQLEEYKVRATDNEVALAECREDLRRLKEKSWGLEGMNEELKRGVGAQMAEVGSLQKRLKESDELESGGGIGVGMSELNPELMQELNMLRSEYIRLKEFESQREADNVQRMIESCDDAKRLSDRFKQQFINTKNELEDTQQLLHESKAREATLRQEVADWTERHRKLGEEMKEERIKAHKAALDMERKFNDAKKALSEKARCDLKELEDKFTLKLDNERKQHKEKTDRLAAERDEIEKRFGQQLTELREQASSNLRSTKEALQQRIDELEQSKKDALETAEREKKEELEAMMSKGKGVLRNKLSAAQTKAQGQIEKANAEIKLLNDELSKFQAIHIDFELKAKAKIQSKTQKIQLLESQNEAAAATNCELEEKVKKAERTSKELASENDRLRRQIGSRGPGGASQTQLEELVSVCNSLRDENRRLKETNSQNFFNASAFSEASASPSDSVQGDSVGISKSALIEYRQEFEEKLQTLEDEKRDLIMRNSAALSDTQKAVERSWELEEELAKVKSELTTAKLAMQRTERRAELTSICSSTKSRKRVSSGIVKENDTPNIHHRAARDFKPMAIQSSTKKSKTDFPSLMDHAKKGSEGVEAQPECNQS